MNRAYATGKPGDYILIAPGDALPGGYTLLPPPSPQAGHEIEWIDGAWAQVKIPEPPEPGPEPTPQLSQRQLFLGLLSIGITEAMVDAMIETIIADPQERAAAMIEWRKAGSYNRDHWLVGALATAFELPANQVDDLWLWAAGL